MYWNWQNLGIAQALYWHSTGTLLSSRRDSLKALLKPNPLRQRLRVLIPGGMLRKISRKVLISKMLSKVRSLKIENLNPKSEF